MNLAAELDAEDRAQLTAPRRSSMRRLAGVFASGGEWLFGSLALIVGLSLLATMPVLQFLSLGYLLETAGRVARTGRVSAGFVGIRKAARLGRLAVGLLVLMIPLWIAVSLRDDARLIDPASRAARLWSLAVVLWAVVVAFQTVTGCLRGGRIHQFLLPRPIKSCRLLFRRGSVVDARDSVWNFVVGLHLPAYFWLGLRGFVGAFVWLIVPVSLLAVASRLAPPVGGFVGLAGGAMLGVVLLYLPFLQARFAAEDRFAALFEVRAVRRKFGRAPLAFLIALVCALVLAIPLYLLKIELIPREAQWLPSLLFVVSIFPARLLAGWALARAGRRKRSRIWIARWASRLAMLPLVALYVLIVYFTQYLSWHGVWSLYEQHAFLLPVPFFGL